MIFSTDTTILLQEIQNYLPFSSNYKVQRIILLLEDTESTFLVPVLGKSLHDRILTEPEATREIEMCRKAVANIMAYMNFTILNTNIVPGGFTRLGGENTNNLYKYQEEDLKKIVRRKGFDELDLIVNHFIEKIDDFPEFKTSEYYLSGQKEIIPNRFVFSKYYKPVSHIVFKHLQPFIHRAIDLDISPLARPDDILKDETKLNLVRPVVVALSIAYAIEDLGINIDETGVWLERSVSGDGIIEKNNLSPDLAATLVANYKKIASRYMDILTKHLSGKAESVYLYSRNNKNKKTFWL